MVLVGSSTTASALTHYTMLASCYTTYIILFVIPPLFQLGSGAEVTTDSVPYEPNTNNEIFVKNTVQNRFLTKNNFDTNFDSLSNNNNYSTGAPHM